MRITCGLVCLTVLLLLLHPVCSPVQSIPARSNLLLLLLLLLLQTSTSYLSNESSMQIALRWPCPRIHHNYTPIITVEYVYAL
ncbi:hypothetical protein BO71DRAFT_394162 [Aspergillus ellipticus CBS 707.79]|uniref:Secreted protein n=1 Tax=Aspergillus ellipticus CBS 707.79 TaxID=1448320 RepID=A0A319F410_9EURO|nr:hypothetical protein BO71DRAFT_394162 [Aspergillus ellipticus CBS 707.79]